MEEKLGLVEFCSYKEKSVDCSSAILSAIKFVRKMKGGSQSILVQANNSRFYVVKMMGTPQGANILANEFMGGLIIRSVGLPAASGGGIYLSNNFIDSHPELWFELPSGKKRPDSGVHYSSLLLGDFSGENRPVEYLSSSQVNTVRNLDAFWGMYILDIWANHQDNRQAIFLRRSDRSREAVFIDHGHMFGGPEWDFQERPGRALHLEKMFYSDIVQKEQITSWISHFQSVITRDLWQVAVTMPDMWHQGDVAGLVQKLTTRLQILPELVERDIDRFLPPDRKKEKNETLRLPDSGVHSIRTTNSRGSVYRCLATA